MTQRKTVDLHLHHDGENWVARVPDLALEHRGNDYDALMQHVQDLIAVSVDDGVTVAVTVIRR